MRDNFVAALSRVLVHEGSWSDHPSDPGGATMKGITLATYRNWLGRPVSKDELRAIPDATVSAIYRSRYWNAMKGDDLPTGIDYAVFDYGVNSGPTRAVRYLQEVVGATVDGKVGPETIAAIGRFDAEDVIRRLCSSRLTFLQGLKTWPVFGKGWERRVQEVERDALLMLSGPVGASPRAEELVPGPGIPPTPPPVRAPEPRDSTDDLAPTSGGASAVAAGVAVASIIGGAIWLCRKIGWPALAVGAALVTLAVVILT